MGRYIIRRLLQAIPLLFICSLVLFVLMEEMGHANWGWTSPFMCNMPSGWWVTTG
jgi:ABC-type dipeptide/oligopeptide/nickel transport system permease component